MCHLQTALDGCLPGVRQQLSGLREAGGVMTRREGPVVTSRLAQAEAEEVLETMPGLVETRGLVERCVWPDGVATSEERKPGKAGRWPGG